MSAASMYKPEQLVGAMLQTTAAALSLGNAVKALLASSHSYRFVMDRYEDNRILV